MDTPGSTNLTPEQQQWYLERTGERFVTIPDRARQVTGSDGLPLYLLSRRERRLQRFRKKDLG